jgi:signal transduction histidine kinase
MQGLAANIAIPLIDSGTTLGFVAVRASTPPEPWGNSWGVLSVIYPFFPQAARMLRNMDVYVRLREKDRLAALGEMAAGLAHEIRNPLGAIKGAAQYLQPQSEGGQGEFLRIIVEEVNRLNKVVTQFLDYSRPLGADFVEADMGVILERTHALFGKGTGASSGVEIELMQPPGGFTALPRVRCAPEQIKQVLLNLVQNSLRSLSAAPPAERGRIRVGVDEERRLRDGARELVLFVEDNGKGIPRENLEKIFIPFFTTLPGGTGLGLPICSRIVEAHGGAIDVVSEEGKLTRFSVRLPVSQRTDLTQ